MVKQSVSVAVFHPENGLLVLLVQRPADDEDLPNAWGLPASTLAAGESWESAVERTGRDKLGVQLTPIGELNRGTTARGKYDLEMKLIEATMQGTPAIPQPVSGVTQYQGWKWGSAEELRPAAERGSLCCSLFLERV